MKFLAYLRSLPQPLRSLYYLFAGCIALGLICTIAGAGGWWAALLGLLAVLMGVSVLTNFNGSADGMARASALYRPWGNDYSKSIMATTRYARFFGGCITLVGVMILLVSL